MDDLLDDYSKTGLYFVSTSPAARARDLDMNRLQKVTGLPKAMLATIVNDRRKARGLKPIGFQYHQNTPIILPDVPTKPPVERWSLREMVKGPKITPPKPTPPPKPIPAPPAPTPGPDRVEALESELAALREMVAALRAEVAYLTGEVHWLTDGAADEFEEVEDEDTTLEQADIESLTGIEILEAG